MPLKLGKKKRIILAVLCISFVGFLIMGFVFDNIVDGIIDLEMKEKLPLKNGTMAFKFWKKPPVPVSFRIYVFDITNPDEIMAGTEVPAVVEKGPYVYTMNLKKTNIKWHDNNTIEYIMPQSFVFDREASVGPDTDTFNTINIPYITVATLLQYEPPFLQKTVDAYFRSKEENTFMRRSVYDIWWGYSDPVLEEVSKILHKFQITYEIFNGKFGFYMDRNNTGDGLYNIYSGMNKNFDNYVEIDRWNGMKNLSIWTTDKANEIRGTDGSMHPPFVGTSDLSIFDAYLHRSLKLKYNGSSSYRGIRTKRFYVPYSEFATASENPDNEGFCTPDIHHCIPSGAYNMSLATYFAPIYVSLPHFVGGDPYYQRQVEGLTPSQEKHQPFYDIQAMTGVSMRAARRYQINIGTKSFEYFTKFQTFPVSYLPVLWIDGMAEINEGTATLLKDLLQDPLDAMPGVKGAVFAFSVVLLLIAIGLFVVWRRRMKKEGWLYKQINDTEKQPLKKGKSQKTSKKYLTIASNGTTESNRSPQANGHLNTERNSLVRSNSNATSQLDSIPPSTSGSLEATHYDDNIKDVSEYFDPRTSPTPDNYESFKSI